MRTVIRKWTVVYVSLFLLLVLTGCVLSLRTKEVLEGSDEWVESIVAGMRITTNNPSGEVYVQQPYDFVLRIDNQGDYEPHLNTLWIQDINGKADWFCVLQEPKPLKNGEQKSLGSQMFFLEPRKVARNTTTIIWLQCTFTQPGIYELLWSADFQESGIAFFSERIILEAH